MEVNQPNGRALLSQNDLELSRHHVLPSMRGGKGNKNIVKIPWYFHRVWHMNFGLLTPIEAICFIEMMNFNFSPLREEIIKNINSYAPIHVFKEQPGYFHNWWRILFNDLNAEEAILFIRIIFLGAGGERRDVWPHEKILDLRLAIKLLKPRSLN